MADGPLDESELPAGFVYPDAFLRVVRLNLVDIPPWELMLGDALRQWQRGITTRYPDLVLVFIGRRDATDEVACFDASDGRVLEFEDFQGQVLPFATSRDFRAWFHKIVDEMFGYDLFDEFHP
jgi:hypothetical protein